MSGDIPERGSAVSDHSHSIEELRTAPIHSSVAEPGIDRLDVASVMALERNVVALSETHLVDHGCLPFAVAQMMAFRRGGTGPTAPVVQKKYKKGGCSIPGRTELVPSSSWLTSQRVSLNHPGFVGELLV